MKQKKSSDKKSPFKNSRKPAAKSPARKSPFEKYYKDSDKKKDDDFFEVSRPGKSRFGNDASRYKKKDGFDKPKRNFGEKPVSFRDSNEYGKGDKKFEGGFNFDKPKRRNEDKPVDTRSRLRKDYQSKVEEKPTFKGRSNRFENEGESKKFGTGYEERSNDRFNKSSKPFLEKKEFNTSKDRYSERYKENERPPFKKSDRFERSSKNNNIDKFEKPKENYKHEGQKRDFAEFVNKERGYTRDKSSGKQDKRNYEKKSDFEYSNKRMDNDEYYELKQQIFGDKKNSGYIKDKKSKKNQEEGSGTLWLSKFIAQAGVCSRRKAADLIKEGGIIVNDEVEKSPAYEVKPEDVVTYKGKTLAIQEERIYLLMNKPKNVITTSDDEKGRKTVLDLIKEDYAQRLFPVGRLDRQTTGLLLLTNDGDLTKKLSHPSHQIKKVYQVTLDQNLSLKDINKIKEGLELEDGLAEVDAIDYVEGGKKNEIGLELHSGKNRIVRRIFEHLGYVVEKLDRTFYAGLNKKDLPRGFYRSLTEKEVIMLKHFTNMRKG